MTALEFPLATAGLMPQANRMLLLDELTAWTQGSGSGRIKARPGHLFLDAAGRLDAAACVESLAQLAAAVKGYEAKLAGGDVRFGYLVGLKHFVFSHTVRAGDTLTLESRRVFEMDAVSVVEGRILRGADRLMSGTLKLYETDALPPHPKRPSFAREKTEREARAPKLFPEERSPVHRALIERLSDFSLQALAPLAEPDPILPIPLIPPISSTARAEEDRRAAGSFLLDDAFPGFDGHFPGYPIQPGVVTLQMGLVLAEMAAGGPLEFRSIEQAKFNRPAYPNETIVVEIRAARAERDLWSVSAKIRRGDDPIASFSFQAEERRIEN